MNNKGFSLVELLGCLVVLGVILGIGLYSARGTLGAVSNNLNQVSVNEIYDAAKIYVLENSIKWNYNEEEYACLNVLELVDYGYFDNDSIKSYENKKIKIVRNSSTKVIDNVLLVDFCE